MSRDNYTHKKSEVGKTAEEIHTGTKENILKNTKNIKMSFGSSQVFVRKSDIISPENTSGGGSFLIAMDSDKLEYAMRKLTNNDEEVASRINYILDEVISILETDYILPSVNPIILNMVDNIKKTLPDFLDFAYEIAKKANEFSSEVLSADRDISKKHKK